MQRKPPPPAPLPPTQQLSPTKFQATSMITDMNTPSAAARLAPIRNTKRSLIGN